MPDQPWIKYRVSPKSSRPNWVDDSCTPFDTVRHVCHIEDAIRIIEDGKIRSSLIWDESILNNTRTCVSWVSPNTWANGSIYGNISFIFDWNGLVEGNDLYWVEAITTYTPTAYRFLLTRNVAQAQVIKYDPASDNGPLRIESNTWYRNGNYTGEIMIDSDLMIRKCTEISFESHHNYLCAKNGKNGCSDRGKPGFAIGSILMAYLLCNDCDSIRSKLIKDTKRGKTLNDSALSSVNHLYHILQMHVDYSGPLIKEESIEKALTGFLFAYSHRKRAEAMSIISLCKHREDVGKCLFRVVKERFNIDHFDFLDD